jgi:soluble lytic murein transglycosylase
LHAKARKALMAAGLILLAGAVARAQPLDPIDQLLQREVPQPVDDGQPIHQTVRTPLSQSDLLNFRQAIASARRGDVNGARAAIAALSDPIARKTATWAMVDANGDSLSFYEVDQARRDLADWPRAARRQNAAEKLVESSGKTPGQILTWFNGAEPQTAQGAMALATAYRGTGQPDKAAALIRHWWRDKSFEADVQRTMLARFGDVLTVDDHVRRADILLYGSQGPAARDMIPLLPADQQQAALARIALRANAFNANDLLAALPASASQSSGVAFERAAYMRRKGLSDLALGQVQSFPKDVVTADQADRIWEERKQLILASLKVTDFKGAYAAANDSGLTFGPDAVDAEFYAGWLALRRLNDPQAAARHFAAIDRIGTSPITKARAYYWQGRAAEAMNDRAGANAFYEAAAQNSTTFYGQLAGAKLGRKLDLGDDPKISAADRARFENRDPVQAMRLLYDNGYKDLFRAFALTLDDVLPTATDEAMLVDLVRGYGDQDTSMKVARGAAQRGFILPNRAYPFRTPPAVLGGVEPALVLGITRQESGFDPYVRSGVGARGMMQLMPTTAAIVARRTGVSYSPSMLDEPDYNMRLGSSFLGQLVNQFSGSYVMAVAAYNAGPGRPTQWSAWCGDPRGAATDPVDFIECIPFSETRNYVMRVMEGMQVYRAKLNGGSAPITLASDLQRGSYNYPPASSAVATAGSGS